MADLNGTWVYQSFCPATGTGDTPAQLAAPWSPRAQADVTTGADGKVTGTLTFGPKAQLAVKGSIIPANGKLPEGIELTAEGLTSITTIRGFFIPGTGTPVIVGTVLAVQNDLAKQPNGTRGAFILFVPQCPSRDGGWSYQSFCPSGATSDTPAQLAAPWVPRAQADFKTGADGKLTGTLTFGPKAELAINGSIVPANGRLPPGIELTAEGLSAIYKIRGYFIEGAATAASDPVIVGSVLAVQNNLAKQPIGTSGPFVLVPSIR